jgi:glycine/D-amino acid oxidase-like deaminating enzyme
MSTKLPRLLVVGAGLFGSQAAAYARTRGIETMVFDAGLPGAASPAAAGLFKEEWAGKKLQQHFRAAVPLLDQLYGIRQVQLTHPDGRVEAFHCVPPSVILELDPIRKAVTTVGDGWLEADGTRYEGFVYVAAGIWSAAFLPGLQVYGKAGTSLIFPGEEAGRIVEIAHGRQAIAFTRDRGTTFFSDGTAESDYSEIHEQRTVDRATELGLNAPIQRIHGLRPYTPGGPLFRRLGTRTWLATGGRKMGTILGAAFARRLIEEEVWRQVSNLP